MKRFLSLLLSVLMILGVLASCGGQTPVGPASSESTESRSEESGTGAEPASGSESETEPATEPEDPIPNRDKPVYEYEYKAPEDGSFTICGIPLSEYTLVMYFPSSSDYSLLKRKLFLSRIESPISSATGEEWKVTTVKNQKFDTEKKSEHEILFGANFQRPGMPDQSKNKNYYGVTEDGTVYFSAMAPGFYGHLFQLFLEEFFGVPYDSGAKSEGCAVTPFYRELPALDEALLRQQGYEKVFVDEFEGDSLNQDNWSVISGAIRAGYTSGEQIRIAEGKLTLTGEYRTDGEYGEAWYGADIRSNTRYCYGYYKAIIKCNECAGIGQDFWSAFWIQAPSPYNPEQSQGGIGPGGSEIDIMECWGSDFFSVTVWVSGYEGNTGLDCDSTNVLHTGNNYGEEYHSFELLWDEEYYRYYLDGQLTYISNFGYGTSHVEEEVRFSLCVPGNFVIRPGTVREMTVESVEIWQKPNAQE